MIKQNHSNVTAVTMLVVLLGCGIGSTEVEAKEKSHNKGHVTHHKVEHHHYVKHEKQRNIKVKDKRDKLSKPSTDHKVRGSKSSKGYKTTGLASWYGPGFHGRRTASGDRFNMYAMTAAHKTLPLDSKVKVTNLKNNKSIIVTINDRGPYVKGRSIDLSLASARALGVIGTAKVQMVVL